MLEDQPLVSIVMPVYNTEAFLRDTLDSILSQTYTNWELIAVDDQSTDESHSTLIAYQVQNPRIRVYQTNVDKGIIPALHLGEKQVRGQLITRMDSDDLMPKDKLSLMVDALADHQHCVVVGKVKYFAESKELADGYKKYEAWLNKLVDDQSHWDHIYRECVVPSPCWMMRREDFELIGGFDGGRYPEDYDLVFRMYQHKLSVITVDRILHLWRDHDARTSRNDTNYSDQSFLPLKLHHFCSLDHNAMLPLVLWGAGKAGKNVAKWLLERNISFRWVTDSTTKQGHNIYGLIVESTSSLDTLPPSHIITAIRQPNFIADNNVRLIDWQRTKGHTFWHFH